MGDDKPLITCEELHASLGAADLCVIDCRFDLFDPDAGRQLYLDGHIPGAVYADLDRDLAAPRGPGTGRHPLPTPDTFAKTLGRLGVSNDSDVVVYDQGSGALAARAWWLLRWAGHDRVRLLDGGVTRWAALGFDLESGVVEPGSGEFRVEPRNELVITTADIVAARRKQRPLLIVDARDQPRFRGESEPIDPVAGHVPGALNLPYSANLRDDGTWKRSEALRAAWKDVLGDDVSSPWGVMCGSGVTACHHVISALVAGLPEPRVYVGSWSEWIRDPDRPVETG